MSCKVINNLETEQNSELESSYDENGSNSSSEINENIDKENIPDITDIDLSKKETFYYKIIDRYYKSLNIKKIETMIDIVEGKSKISLRLLDWFVTRYANKYKIRFEKTESKINNEGDDKFDKKVDKGFNVHISYKAQLKSYKKRYFDPFRRRKKFAYYFDKEKKTVLCTTIGQLNFFKWAFSNDVIDYVANNYNTISKAMVNTNKLDKTRKLKEKKDKIIKDTKDAKDTKDTKDDKITKDKDLDNQNDTSKDEEIFIKKNGVNVSAKKKVRKGEVQIVLSFD